MSKVKEAVSKELTKEGLPKEAFAIVGDPTTPRPGSCPIIPNPSLEPCRVGSTSKSLSLNEVKEPLTGTECPQR